MAVYAHYRGERFSPTEKYIWVKLTTACSQMGIEAGNAQRALDDARLALALLKALASKAKEEHTIVIIVPEGQDMIVDTTKRYEKAKEIATEKGPPGSVEYRGAFYEAFNDARYIALDTLVADAQHALAQLEKEYSTILFLTSRPHYLHEATVAWLKEQRIWSEKYQFRLKDYSDSPVSERYTQNAKWKAAIVTEAAAIHSKVLFIDTT
jgi:hypothetical protein